jgi:thiamine biosynthesis protein ThiS
MIHIYINGEQHTFEQGLTVAEMLPILNYTTEVFAIAINGEILRKEDYTECLLEENTEVEILSPMCGG